MAESKMSLEKMLSIAAIIIALGGSVYSGLHTQNSLEYLTKADFNIFQIDNVKKMTSLEGTVQNGFQGVSQQLSSLQFVSQKDFQDLKDKSIASTFELQKSIDFLKKDLETLQKNAEANAAKIAIIEQKIAVLESQKKTNS
jgi:hypothetical protein